MKKHEKEILSILEKMDEQEKEESKVLGKLIKEGKNEQLKESSFFIGELKRIETLVMNEVACFADRGHKILNFIKVIIKM